jgi:hypothetical protein
MPNVFDQFDTEANPFDQFDQPGRTLTATELETGAGPLELAAHPGGQVPYSPLSGGYAGAGLGPSQDVSATAALAPIVRAFPEAINEDVTKILPKPVRTFLTYNPIIESIKAIGEKIGSPATVGVGEGLENVTEGLRSPLALATFGSGELPALGQRALSLAFAAQMAKDIPDVASQLGEELGKPEGQRDNKKIARLITQGTGTSAFTAMAGLHGLTPKMKGGAYAPEERQVQEGVPTERPGDGQRGAPAEAGARGGLPSEAGLGKEAPVPLSRAEAEAQGPEAVKNVMAKHGVDRDTAVAMISRARRVYGISREVPFQKPGEPVTLGEPAPEERMTADEQDYLDEERKGMGAGIEVGSEHLEEGLPFAPNQAATINRKTGKVVINPEEFRKALAELPPEDRAAYVKSLVAEERDHLETTDEDADTYAGVMTGLEKVLETRVYTGKWTRAGAQAAHGMPITDRMLGYEAIKRRLAQLRKMSPTETVMTVGRERWKMEQLNTLQRIVSRIMETLPTERGNVRRALLEKVQGNLDAARFVAAGGNPSSLSRPKDQIEETVKMDANAFNSLWGTGKAGLTAAAYRMGEKITTADIPDLMALREQIHKQDFADLKAGKPNTMGLKGQYINEAVKWRQALEEAKAMGSPTLADFAALEKKYGIGEGLEKKGEDLQRSFEKEQGVYNLDEAAAELRNQPGREFAPAIKDASGKVTEGTSHDELRRSGVAGIPGFTDAGGNFLTMTEVARRKAEAAPSSLRRPKAPKEHPELLLPPVKGAAEVERGGFRQPAAGEITQMTDQFFSNVKASGKLPSFEEFSNTLRSQFGSQVTRDSIYYAWQDSLTKHLMQATGDELARMLPEVGVKRDVAEALQPTERDPYIGKIPDVANEEQMLSQIEYIRKMFNKKPWMSQEEFKRKYGPQIAQKFNVPFQRRYAAIGAIMDKLTQKAGDAPEKPWDRKEIGPEDIGQTYLVEGALPKSEAEKVQAGEMAGQFPTIESRRLITRIPAEEAGDAKRVGELATANAAVDATGKAAPPRTVSKNVMALLDRDGKVTLVSAWRDPRTGPKITNPDGASLPSEKITDKLLKSWSPMVVMTLRDPVQKFHQKFDSVNDFEKWFGDVGIEGTPGIRTSSFTGPMAGITREQAGLGSATTLRPKESMLPPPPAEFVSPTAREISTLRGRAPTEVAGAPRGTGAPEPPPAVPHEPEMLSPEAQQALSAELAQGENPYMGEAALRTLAHREVPKKKYTLESHLRYGASALREMEGTPERRLRRPPTSTPESGPSSLRRAKQVTNDEMTQLFKSLRAIGKRRVVKKDLPRIFDGQERLADQAARQVGEIIRMVSTKSSSRADMKEARMVRAAAKAVIASTSRAIKYEKQQTLTGFTPKGLYYLKQDIASARTMAELWSVSSNPVKRLWAPTWRRAIDRLEREIDYARDHWDDPQLQRTAAQILKEGKDEIDYENKNGFDVTERAYYLPGRYEGAFWSDSQVVLSAFGGSRKLLGEQYRGPKRFRDMYEAISKGPFIPADYDPAVLMESRVRSGRYRVAQLAAREMWKDMRDPETGKPIAVAPKMVPKEDPQTGQVHMQYFPPSLEYSTLIYPSDMRRGVPLAVSEPYVNMIQSLSDKSHIGRVPGGREALMTASILKHGWLLVGDLYHFARLSWYGASLAGKRWWDINVNYKGGFTALNWRPEDMPEAVEKGFITQEAADWVNETAPVKNRDGTYTDRSNYEVGRALMKNGLNSSRVIDAMYKDAIRNIPLIGEPWHKIIGPYNRWLFDRYTSGLMLQKAVENFRRLHEKFPEHDLQSLTRDVVTDMNTEFGNMGRQGIFRNPTFRDFAQIFLLAPMWREGIIGKEVRTYSRLAKAGVSLAKGDLRGAQYHVETPVTRSMLRGVAAYFVLTQVMNLISRKQFTWQNPEHDHKMDAFIPTGHGTGFWISPMSVFMEMTHDVNRLMGSRPTAHAALVQIGVNALGPVGKAAKVIATGEDEFGRKLTTTAGVLKTAAGELAPMPLSFGAPAKAIAHKLAPETFSPPRPGSVQRQMFGWAGMKGQPADSKLVQARRMADDFVEKNNLKIDQGFVLTPTDAASYSSLRSALVNDDVKETRKIFNRLREQHPVTRDSKGKIIKDPIAQAMATWAQRPLTGSYDNENMFMDSLNDKDFELYNQALDEKQNVLNKYIDWYVMQSGEK